MSGAAALVHKIGSAFGKDSTPIATIHCWCARFEGGDKCFEDMPRLERPLAVDDSDILDTVKEDPELNTHSLATRHVCAQSAVVSRLPHMGGETRAKLGHGSTPFLFN
uniref:HTH_48 domain-containing protein n=1 Tax=Haemonchus contortus TaxID=6289 RepID=A0A7I4XSQ4_HAECO